MSKDSKNIGAVLAVLFLALLVVGIIFVVKNAYVDEPKFTEQFLDQTDPTVPTATTTEPPRDTRIALFETTDINGYLIDTTSGDPSTFQYRMAYIARAVDNARNSESYDDVILVDAGDIYQGMPVSYFTEGAAMRAAIDLMGYDAVALGNHDFDWDVTIYAADTFSTVPSYELGEYIGECDVPVIASTLCFTTNHNRTLFTKDYVMVEKAGYRIAIIGYIPDYSADIDAEKMEPYEIHDDLSEFSEKVKKINEQEMPDVTIVVAHDNPEKVANALNHEDVDLITGGRTDTAVFGVAESGIPFIQADKNAQGYAGCTIVIAPDGTVRVEDANCVSIVENPEELYDTSSNIGNFNADVLALSHAAWDAISESMTEALGYIDTNVQSDGYVDSTATTAGNFVTSLMLECTKDEDTMIALCNGAEINANFEAEDGNIYELSVGDVYSICPNNNRWLIYDLSGSELAQLLADGVANSAYGDQVSGLTFTYNNNGTAEEPDIEIVSITLDNGTSVDISGTEAKYRVVISSGCANQPGSVFEGKEALHAELDSPVDNQSIIAYLRDRRDRGQVHIPTDSDSRSTWLNEPSE